MLVFRIFESEKVKSLFQVILQGKLQGTGRCDLRKKEKYDAIMV
jgi:hypothetical protein